MPNLWLLPRPMILASKSQARRSLLAAAGIPFEGIEAQIEERAFEAPLRASGLGGAEIAAALAREKALKVSAARPDRLVLGGDQTLSLDGLLLSKPVDLAAAGEQINSMSGKMHTLHAAFCLVRDGVVVAQACEQAHLICRTFSAAFVECYLHFAGESVLQSVGGYAIEGLGIHLFERIVGEQSTVLGLPMLPLLDVLRRIGAVEH